MKITVWTSSRQGRAKCIFNGESSHLPGPGDYVVCRDGFGAERVFSVTLNLYDQTAEITVWTSDGANEYGPCLHSP